MINCPNCDKQIADDSAHCGYCGHQIEEKQKKKTMFGMAAISGDELEDAVEKAKQAKERGGGDDGGGAPKKPGGLKIPKPGPSSANKSRADQKSSSTKSSGAGGGFKIPKPGQKSAPKDDAKNDEQDEAAWAKTERIDLSDAEEPCESEAKTQAMQQPSPQHEFSPQDSSTGLGAESSATINVSNVEPEEDEPVEPSQPSGPSFGEPAGPGPSQVSQAGAQSGPFGPGAQEANEAEQAQQPQPSQGGGFSSSNVPNPSAKPGDEQGQMQAHEVGTGGPPVPQEKSNKGKIIAIILVALAFGGACVLGAAAYALDYFGIISIF